MRGLLLAAATGLVIGPLAAMAQPNPVIAIDLCSVDRRYCTGRVVTVVVGASPGSATDRSVRLFADALSPVLRGVGVTVENRVGAGGMSALDSIARAPDDGSTLLVASWETFLVAGQRWERSRAAPQAQLVPVAEIASLPYVLVVASRDSARSATDLVSEVRLNRTKDLAFASAGTGSGSHVLGELLSAVANLTGEHIPFRGLDAAVRAVATSEVRTMFAPLSSVAMRIREGSLRALAITGPRRSEVFPDLPTLSEAGFEEANVSGWLAIFAPPGTSPELQRALTEASTAAAMSHQFTSYARAAGLERPTTRGPEQFAALLREQNQRILRIQARLRLE